MGRNGAWCTTHHDDGGEKGAGQGQHVEMDQKEGDGLSLRIPAIIVRSGSVCDDVVFLASDTRWLAVKSDSMKLICASLHWPHRRISLVDNMSMFTALWELSWATVVSTGLCLVRTRRLSSGVAVLGVY